MRKEVVTSFGFNRLVTELRGPSTDKDGGNLTSVSSESRVSKAEGEDTSGGASEEAETQVSVVSAGVSNAEGEDTSGGASEEDEAVGGV